MQRQTLMQNALTAAQEAARLGFSATSEALLRVAWELYFCTPTGADEAEAEARSLAEAPPSHNFRRPE